MAIDKLHGELSPSTYVLWLLLALLR